MPATIPAATCGEGRVGGAGDADGSPVAVGDGDRVGVRGGGVG